MSREAKQFQYRDIVVGQATSFSHVVTSKDVEHFATLSGDHSPLHVDPAFAQGSQYGRVVAHGMIAGALFSRLVGMELPGKYAVYLSQQMSFRSPIFPGDELTVTGVVAQKVDAHQSVVMELSAKNTDGVVCVDGTALVKVTMQ